MLGAKRLQEIHRELDPLDSLFESSNICLALLVVSIRDANDCARHVDQQGKLRGELG